MNAKGHRSRVVAAVNLFLDETKPLFTTVMFWGRKKDIVKTEYGVKMEERHIFK